MIILGRPRPSLILHYPRTAVAIPWGSKYCLDLQPSRYRLDYSYVIVIYMYAALPGWVHLYYGGGSQSCSVPVLEGVYSPRLAPTYLLPGHPSDIRPVPRTRNPRLGGDDDDDQFMKELVTTCVLPEQSLD